jgi:chemotaxis protein MotB
VTLLFALFTVMYAVSSVNEGKFRVLSDAMIAAFRGAPKSLRPVNIGEKETGKGGDKQLSGVTPTVLLKLPGQSKIGDGLAPKVVAPAAAPPSALERMAHDVEAAMQDLIDAKLVRVRRDKLWVEVEINTDILFPSGSSGFSEPAVPVLDKLAEVLKPFPNPIRVEGHTDDRPIHTTAFPSNWELSAARAATVVHEFTKVGVDPLRLEIVGFGEYHPVHANDSVAGRNMNRRVTILILEKSLAADAPGTASPGPAAAGAAAAVAAMSAPASTPATTPAPAAAPAPSSSPASDGPTEKTP